MVPESWQGKTKLQQTFFLSRSTFVGVGKLSACYAGQFTTQRPRKWNAECPLYQAVDESRISYEAVQRIRSSTIQQEIESQYRKEKLQP